MNNLVWRCLIGCLLFCAILVSSVPTVGIQAKAIEQQSATTAQEAAKQLDLQDRQFGPYKNSKIPPRYQDIDVATFDIQKSLKDGDNENKISWNPFTTIANYFGEAKDDVMGSMQDIVVSIFLMLVQTAFQFNIMMTNFMLSCLHFSMNGDLINFLITMMQGKIQQTAGISNGNIGTTGTFGALAGLFALISVAYMAFQFSVKRAPLEGVKSLMQPLVALTISIVIISNFGLFLTGLNTLTSSVASSISTATQEKTADGSKLNRLEDGIFKMMVYRPWLYLQFGTADESQLDSKRIEGLLMNKPETVGKNTAIRNEIKNHENEMLQPGSIISRLVLVTTFTWVNAFLSLPIWLASFVFLGFQLYFILVAAMAPFVLILAVLPNQFGVLTRYLVELTFPLGAKLMFSCMALIIFTISDFVYQLPMTNGLIGYYISVYMQFVILMILFMMRKRIGRLYGGARGVLRTVREGSKQVTEPIKDGFEKTTTATGAVVGAAFGGPQGLMVGANVGSMVGEGMTGKRGLTDLTGDVTQMAIMSKLGGIGNAAAATNAATTGKGKTDPEATNPPKGEDPGATGGNSAVDPNTEDNPETNGGGAVLPVDAGQDVSEAPPLHDLEEPNDAGETHPENRVTVDQGQTVEDKPLHDLQEPEEPAETTTTRVETPPEVQTEEPSPKRTLAAIQPIDEVPEPTVKESPIKEPPVRETVQAVNTKSAVETSKKETTLHSLDENPFEEEQKHLEKLEQAKDRKEIPAYE